MISWTKAGPVEVTDDSVKVRSIEATRQASTGEPGAMALFGFATGTLIAAWVISGFVPKTGPNFMAVVPPVLLFAGIAQFVGGLFAFAKSNTFGGTAFCAYGANNAVIAMFYWLQHAGIIPMTYAADIMLALELLCFGYISFVLGIAALRLNRIFTAIVWALVPGFVLAAMPLIVGGGMDYEVGQIGGYFMLLSALLAFYGGTALVVNSTNERQVLPL